MDAKSASSFAESGDVNLASGTSASQTSGRVSIHTSTGSRGGDIDLVVGTGESSSSGSVLISAGKANRGVGGDKVSIVSGSTPQDLLML